MAPKLKICM